MIGKLVLMKWSSDKFFGIVYGFSDAQFSVAVAPSASPFLDNKHVTSVSVSGEDLVVVSENDPQYQTHYQKILSELVQLSQQPLQHRYNQIERSAKQSWGIIEKLHQQFHLLKELRKKSMAAFNTIAELETEVGDLVKSK